MSIIPMDPKVYVAPQLWPENLSALRDAGFRTVINNRPDGEESRQPSSADLAAIAAQMGLAYHHIPVAPGGMTDRDALAFGRLVAAADGPVLAFCRSGSRSAALWKRCRQLNGLPTDMQG